MKINTGTPAPRAQTPVVTKGPPPKKKFWGFSFSFWKQEKWFGIGDVKSSWLVSLLERMRQLSSEPISRFFEDLPYQHEMRYHEIDWTDSRTSFQWKDLNWLPKNVQQNPTEYPLYQIEISTGVGRIIGYWDVDWTFCVVLLDPMHNAQLTKYAKYKLRPTSVAGGDYSALHIALEEAKAKKCGDTSCKFYAEVNSIKNHVHDDPNVILAKVDDNTLREMQSLISGGEASSVSEILAIGVGFYRELK